MTDKEKDRFTKWAAKKAQIAFRLDPEFKAEIDAHVARRGERMNDFIKRAIAEQIKRDSESR